MSRKTLFIITFIIFLMMVFGRWLYDNYQIDQCLDAGGAWNHQAHVCDK
ncbi:hypothetical protein [Hydromonas duriensis]|uniref:Uncharacterized protein n=1 Tax=Hydromonas duriensis TaxID=1527608 RepID=A0A4R6YBH0_9BURK|nr:hypothetical protein [Hydromonas duriensis]TDR32996.1 hypothetical protein DFR44_10145 [Hydromonas duriensis]